MIDFYITEQSIRFASPVIAANSLNFLEAQFHFSGDTWDGFSKWAHFRQGETVFDLNLENDMITPEMGLNLSLGEWEVYLTGNCERRRLTTVPVILTVMESGLVDEPLHSIPQSVAEQVDNKASLALSRVMELIKDAEGGKFDGDSFKILGYYKNAEELAENIDEPKAGDMYAIGREEPYEVYVYDALNGLWVNNGPVVGLKGDRGEAGAVFTPSVSENGNLSWSNNGGLENPAPVNIIGPKGDKGEKGEDGKGPFEIAVEEGYQGTQETFYWMLKNIASHAKTHEAGGSDPISFTADMIPAGSIGNSKIRSGSVTADKLSPDAVCMSFKDVEIAKWEETEEYEQFPFRGVIELEGVSKNMLPEVCFSIPDAVSGNFAPGAESFDGGIYIYAAERPETKTVIPTVAVWRNGEGGVPAEPEELEVEGDMLIVPEGRITRAE